MLCKQVRKSSRICAAWGGIRSGTSRRRRARMSSIGMCLVSISLLSLPLKQLAAGEETIGVGFALENGDTNGDGDRDVSDGIYLLRHLFLGGPAPVPIAYCVSALPAVENGDSNGDAAIGTGAGIPVARDLLR